MLFHPPKILWYNSRKQLYTWPVRFALRDTGGGPDCTITCSYGTIPPDIILRV